MALYYYGEDFNTSGRCPEALPIYREGLEVHDHAEGLDHPDRAFFLTVIAECELILGHTKEAVAMLEQALATREKSPMLQGELARTRFALARGLIATGGDRERADELSSRAEEEYRRIGLAFAKELEAVSAWRAKLWQHPSK
jgi:tetratricopeptide (TPR) repeat protein